MLSELMQFKHPPSFLSGWIARFFPVDFFDFLVMLDDDVFQAAYEQILRLNIMESRSVNLWVGEIAFQFPEQLGSVHVVDVFPSLLLSQSKMSIELEENMFISID